MNRSKLVWALAGINLLLAVVLTLRLLPDSRAYGQAHRPGDYMQMPASIPGNNNGIMYILDTSTGQLTAATYDETARQVKNVMAPVQLNRIFQQPNGANQGVR